MDPWVLFLGAGASVPPRTNLPDFATLAAAVLQALGWHDDWVDEEGTRTRVWSRPGFPSVRDPGRAVSPEVLFGTLKTFGVPFATEVARVLDTTTPNAVHAIAAQVLSARGMVWTTNVDRAVEGACEILPPRFGRQIPGRPSGSSTLRPLQEAAPGGLVKFHGSAEEPASLAFTDRELLTPLSGAETTHLVSLLSGHTLVLYGYAGADADLADLLDAAFGAAVQVIWLEPFPESRSTTALFFPQVTDSFAPQLPDNTSRHDELDATRAAWLDLASQAGYEVNDDELLRAFEEEPSTPEVQIELPATAAIVNARIVSRFGSPDAEDEAYKAAWREDKGRRLKLASEYASWRISRSLYSGGPMAYAVRGGAVVRPLLRWGPLRRLSDALLLRQYALLLPAGRWQKLQRLAERSLATRRRPDGSTYPADHYYRAYALRYRLRPAEAAEDAEHAISKLADALDPERLAGALLESGAAGIYQGDFRHALRRAFELQYRRGRYAIPRWQSWGAWLEAIARCHLLDPAEAEEAIRRAERRFAEEHYQHALTDLSAAQALAGRVAVALGTKSASAVRSSFPNRALSRRQHDDWHLLHGDLCLADGDIKSAAEHYQRVARRPSCPVAQAWADLGGAEVDRVSGRLSAANRFHGLAITAAARGATWLEAQAILGLHLTGDDRVPSLWGELQRRLPNAPMDVLGLAVGNPRVLWTVTV